MLTKRLSPPNIVFVDCMGSYFMSIYNYFSDQRSQDDLLFILSNCHLDYRPLSIEGLKKTSVNPWLFQPVKLYSDTNIELFENGTSSLLFNYLLNKFNIESREIQYNSNIDLIDIVIKNTSKDKKIIIILDDFYIPHSKKCYQKYHNSHALLVESVFLKDKTIKVVDSEYSQIKTTGTEDLVRAYHAKKGLLTIVECKRFDNTINYKMVFKKYLKNYKDNKYLTLFIDDLNSRFKNEKEHIRYIFEGVNYSILFKILPVVRMRYNLLCKLDERQKYLFPIKKTLELIEVWKGLSLFLLRNIITNKLNTDYLLNRLVHIRELENRLIESLHSYSGESCLN